MIILLVILVNSDSDALPYSDDLQFTRWQHWSAILPLPDQFGSCF